MAFPKLTKYALELLERIEYKHRAEKLQTDLLSRHLKLNEPERESEPKPVRPVEVEVTEVIVVSETTNEELDRFNNSVLSI